MLTVHASLRRRPSLNRKASCAKNKLIWNSTGDEEEESGEGEEEEEEEEEEESEEESEPAPAPRKRPAGLFFVKIGDMLLCV